MEKVVSKLSEIEAAAVAIMDNATAQKKELSDEMNEKIKRFDEEVDLQTANSIQELTQRLEVQKEAELAQLKENTLKTLAALEDDYNKNHTNRAKALLNQIVRM